MKDFNTYHSDAYKQTATVGLFVNYFPYTIHLDFPSSLLSANRLFQVLGTIFFLLASILYQPPPPESPQSSCESTDHGVGDMSDLPVKDLPEDGVIVNLHARL